MRFLPKEIIGKCMSDLKAVQNIVTYVKKALKFTASRTIIFSYIELYS